jgi:hypothetical protein
MLSESVLVELIRVQKWVIKLSSSACYLTVCTETLEEKYASSVPLPNHKSLCISIVVRKVHVTLNEMYNFLQ